MLSRDFVPIAQRMRRAGQHQQGATTWDWGGKPPLDADGRSSIDGGRGADVALKLNCDPPEQPLKNALCEVWSRRNRVGWKTGPAQRILSE